MLIALTLIVCLVVSTVLLVKLGVAEKKRHEIFVEMNAVCAFAAYGTVLSWLMFGLPRGQHPSFSLWPLVIVGVLFILSGLRAHKVYKDRYGTTPASS
jgi:cytochrome bd-type quinol oxidase subunit 2